MSEDGGSRAEERPVQPVHGLILAGILLAGALLRLFYLLELQSDPQRDHPMRDSAYHHHWAVGLSEGRWDVRLGNPDPKIPTSPFFRPPGYPYFLGLVYWVAGPSPLAAHIVQILLGLLNSVLGFALGRRWFGPRVGLLMAGLMAVSWIFIYAESQLLEPALLVSLTLGMLFALSLLADRMRAGPGLLAGVLLGLAALVRPNVLPFGLAAVLWIGWLGRRQGRGAWRPAAWTAALFALGAVLSIAPVTIRNWIVGREFVPICCNGGINLYLSNNPYANGIDPAGPGLWSWNSFDYPQIVKQLGQSQRRAMTHGEASAWFAQEALRYVKECPRAALRLTVKKALLFWGPKEIGNEKEVGVERRESRALRYLPLSFPLTLALAVAGLGAAFLRYRRRDREGRVSDWNRQQAAVAVLLVGFVAVSFATYVPFFAAARFRIPVIPPLLLFGALAVDQFLRQVERGARTRAVTGLVAVVLLSGAASLNLGGGVERPERWHVDRGSAYALAQQWAAAREELEKALLIRPDELMAHFNLGICYRETGQFEKALEHFLMAARVSPDYEKAHLCAAMVALRLGRGEVAAQCFSEALRINPGQAGAHGRLGLIQATRGEYDQAIGHFTEALRLQPDYPQMRVAMGYALLEQKKHDEARRQFQEVLQANPNDALAREGLKKAQDGKTGE